MPSESQIPIASSLSSRRFARRLSLFYGSIFAVIGCHLPFFTVWLKAVGIEAAWIGIIAAVPAVTRFTMLPVVTGLAERHAAVRGAMMVTAIVTAIGFAVIGTQHLALAVFLIYAVTAASWTPTVPLTDAYALRGVARYGLEYGSLRLWGSAAFIAGALGCGLLADVIAPKHLIWVIVATAALAALIGLGLQPLDSRSAKSPVAQGRTALLRDGSFLGGGTYFYLTGTYSCSSGRWKGEATQQEHTPAPHTFATAGRNVSVGFSGTYTEKGAELEATALVGKRSLRYHAKMRLLVAD